jgi:hypothetical protein
VGRSNGAWLNSREAVARCKNVRLARRLLGVQLGVAVGHDLFVQLAGGR